jgi:hypothetical protein
VLDLRFADIPAGGDRQTDAEEEEPAVETTRPRPDDRVRLVSTPDPWQRVEPGEEGRVLEVDGHIVRVAWDSGHHMPVYLCPSGDRIEVMRR